ncbi:MAG: hypothetical protein WA268_28060 [Xanthobacteraceae bacterium]|jgi:hypothetical protein
MLGLSIWHWLLLAVVLGMTVATGMIASRKNRSLVGWIILGLMFNPVVLIILSFLPDRAPNET